MVMNQAADRFHTDAGDAQDSANSQRADAEDKFAAASDWLGLHCLQQTRGDGMERGTKKKNRRDAVESSETVV